MAYYAQDDEETLTLIKEYFEITDKRNEIIGSELANVEDFYKTIEGSASYIEANSYMTQNNRKCLKRCTFWILTIQMELVSIII